MITRFTKTVNGTVTCTVDGIHLHSSYNPHREAQRFVESMKNDFSPKYIVITEPGLSYCHGYLRERFPAAKLCAIRYSKDFYEYDSIWDKVFYANSATDIGDQLFNFMGEEGICCCLFSSWQPSEKIYAEINKSVWNKIKETVVKSRNILYTSSYFSKRWAKNCLRFSALVSNFTEISKGTSPILIAASGPSLKSSLRYIKKFRNTFFLLAVSSAVSVLIENEIYPDLIISTDGGYWAKKHIAFSLEKKDSTKQIPVALSMESACYGKILSEHNILPLSYGDGYGETFIKDFNLNAVHAQRNGTVSGTAAELALQLTSGPVFFCGLDLYSAKGFTHTQPNELEKNNYVHDGKLYTTETRITPSTFKNLSLDIYCNWFRTQNFGGRLFRLSNNFRYSNSLNKTKDINWNDFENLISAFKNTVSPSMKCNHKSSDMNFRISEIKKIVNRNIHNQEWIKNSFPAENLLYERCNDPSEKEKIKNKIEKRMKEFCKDILAAVEQF